MSPRVLRAIFLAAAIAAMAALVCEQVVEAAPSLTLSPDSGPAPSANGSLSGSGWECSPGVVPGGSATVSGRGVSGSASIGRAGGLTGDFDVTGDAGDSVTVTVTADTACPGIGPPVYLSASATFEFDDPTPEPTATPTRTRTPTPASSPTPPPTNTAAPQPTATPPRATPTPPRATATRPPGASPTAPAAETPVASPTIPAPQPSPGTDTVSFPGCVPGGPVTLEFVPLHLLGGLADPAPTGPGMMVPAEPSAADPSTFEFNPPPAEPGRLFQVKPKADDAGCVLPQDDLTDYWIAGMEIVLPMEVPGSTQLQLCGYGSKSPCEIPDVKGARTDRGAPAFIPQSAAATADGWITETTFYNEELAKRKFLFRSIVDNPGAKAGKLQASVLPFAKGSGPEPPGIIATWDIECVNCEFTLDLSVLAPKKEPKKESFIEKTWEVVKKPVTLTVDAVQWFGGLIGIGGGTDDDKVIEAVKDTGAATLPGEYAVSTAPVIAMPSTYYFRLLPLSATGGDAKGPPSNAVTLERVGKPEPFKIESTPTAVPVESPYEVQIISYHGIVPPLKPNDSCYIATEDAWPADIYGFTYTTDPSKAVGSAGLAVKKGHLFCPPKPKEPSLFETLLSWAEAAVNWASEAWDDLKDFAVEVMLKYTPFGLQCGLVEDAGAIPDGACETAFAIALDGALVALGIPPDIPNFDELMDQGIEYLAAELAAQIAIPPDVVKAAVEQGGPYAGMALSLAEEKLREELQKEMEAKLGDAAKSIGLGYAAAVAFVPDGIPVRPDDYQQPAMTARVTRKPGVPGGEAGCTLFVNEHVTLTSEQVNNPAPGWGSIKNLPHPLSQLTQYNFFADEKPFNTKALHVPPLNPGESYDIPMTFRPNYYKNGWSPLGLVSTSDFIYVWQYLHEFGKITLNASGCGSDKLEVPAKAAVIGAQVVP